SRTSDCLVKFQRVAPKRFVTERVKTERLPSLIDRLASIFLNDFVEIWLWSSGRVLTHSPKRQTQHRCRDYEQEYGRNGFQLVHPPFLVFNVMHSNRDPVVVRLCFEPSRLKPLARVQPRSKRPTCTLRRP